MSLRSVFNVPSFSDESSVLPRTLFSLKHPQCSSNMFCVSQAHISFPISQMTSHLIEKAKTALLLSITTVIHVKLESIRIITFEYYLLKTVLLTSCHGRYSLSLFFSPIASKLVSLIDFTDAHKATNKLKTVANHTRDLV